MAIPALSEAAGRDPFTPFQQGKQPTDTDDVKSEEVETAFVTPLTKDPLSYYQLAGVIISPWDSFVLIKSMDKREHFATIGDSLGKEGGVIDLISVDGITVDIDGKLINLTVTNRFDINDGNN
jgi:Tfp pilus assembly protein PilP